MQAIIQTGGKQYQVEKGDKIEVELLETDKGPIKFSEVLFVRDDKATHIGTPHVEKFVVTGEVLGEKKGDKVVSFKYKRRKNYRRKKGHRQNYSVVEITGIERSK